MPDLLVQEITPEPKMLPQIDMKTTEDLIRVLIREIRNAHPNQRAIVRLVNGSTVFPSETNVEVIFENETRRVKSHCTYISNNTADDTLWYSWDAPITFNTPAINAYQLTHGSNTVISSEIQHLYLYIHHAAGALTYAVNNSDNGSAIQIIKIDAYTNPEEGLA